jgi:hypothetical protein
MIDTTFKLVESDEFLKVLSELEKPFPKNSIFADFFGGFFAEAFVLNGPINEMCTPSTAIQRKLDYTRCYAYNDSNNKPRSVSEHFQTKAVEKLYQ